MSSTKIGVPVGYLALAMAAVLVLSRVCRKNQQIRLRCHPKLWLVFQMLTSFWEAFYQHKITRSKNDITSLERGYGMIHEDGDNDAIGGNDDERAISWKQ
ncbi:hypothetical protein Tco_1185340 [Tanacetum coccineum]